MELKRARSSGTAIGIEIKTLLGLPIFHIGLLEVESQLCSGFRLLETAYPKRQQVLEPTDGCLPIIQETGLDFSATSGLA